MSDRVLPRARLIILYFSYIDIFQMPLINQDSFTISELMHLWVRETVFFFKISDCFIKFILYFIFSSLQILGLYYMSRTADQDFLSKVEKANRGLHCIAERFWFKIRLKILLQNGCASWKVRRLFVYFLLTTKLSQCMICVTS